MSSKKPAIDYPFRLRASLFVSQECFAPARWQRPCPFPAHEKLYEVVRLRLQGFFESVASARAWASLTSEAFSSAFFLLPWCELFLTTGERCPWRYLCA